MVVHVVVWNHVNRGQAGGRGVEAGRSSAERWFRLVVSCGFKLFGPQRINPSCVLTETKGNTKPTLQHHAEASIGCWVWCVGLRRGKKIFAPWVFNQSCSETPVGVVIMLSNAANLLSRCNVRTATVLRPRTDSGADAAHASQSLSEQSVPRAPPSLIAAGICNPCLV